jgi:adenosylcobalamin-dependent ribonucleoside-triphosphate reductase
MTLSDSIPPGGGLVPLPISSPKKGSLVKVEITHQPSIRADVIFQRSYSRPAEISEYATGSYESFEETIDRVIAHQKWLWERAKGAKIDRKEQQELVKLRKIFLNREALPSGRTMWLGGTHIAKTREASQFNCSFLRIETVHDVVDAYHLLLQGCGVGFEPVVGTLNGFSRPVELEIVRSKKTDPNDKGNPDNVEWFRPSTKPQSPHKHWHIRVGDSAEAWAKLPGKILANKASCEKLTLDFSEIRPAGARLSQYGWISSGDEKISKALEKIVDLLNKRNNRLLTRMDILDIMNLLGDTLSSRRSAEICLMPYGDPEWVEFARAKSDLAATPWRVQSNNTVLFWHKPTEEQLREFFQVMQEAGGSEPGIANAANAVKRAPWFKGFNPCAEILLANKSFCNLVEIDLGKFNGRYEALEEAIRLVARANYRQTCVNLDDGILQRTWHELNEFLRLTGVGLTGIVTWEYLGNSKRLKGLKQAAGKGMMSMADELRLPYSKAVTTVKPSGTLSKVMDTTEGVHKPLGKFIFNNVKFGKHDPNLPRLIEAGYHTFTDPYDAEGVLVRFPVEWSNVRFDKVYKDAGDRLELLEINTESAITQLERYRWLMDDYVEHNCSITVSYSPEEVDGIIGWLLENWDSYVAVSFLYRNDPTKTAEDLGYAYLPQEVVSEATYRSYVETLRPLSLLVGSDSPLDEQCATGACPIR